MRLIHDYMRENALRHALNTLTRATFGFDFEAWYAGGFWEGDYIPYSYEEDGRLLANVSVNRMRLRQNGQERLYIQLGTVMTVPEHRRRGLASSLMREALADWVGHCDGVYLFAALDALPFYEKQGFVPRTETRYTLRADASHLPASAPVRDRFAAVSPQDARLRARYLHAVRSGAPFAAFEQINRFSLTMFYTASLAGVLYSPALDCFAVLDRSGDGALTLQSIANDRPVALSDVITHLPEGGPLTLGFTPLAQDAALFDAHPYDGGDDYRLLCLGDSLRAIETDRLCFPALSHA